MEEQAQASKEAVPAEARGADRYDWPDGAGGAGSASRLLDQMGLGELKRLLPLVCRQYEPLLAGRKTICLVGPVNTGKSSLYNAFVAPAAPRAEVSPVPGTTRRALRGDAEAFWIVDTPGANDVQVGAEGPAASKGRHAEAMAAAARADFLVVVFDAARGIALDEVTILGELAGLGKPFVVALNKIDLVKGSEEEVLRAAAGNLQLSRGEIIPVSARYRLNLNRLLLAMLEADPQLLAALADLAPRARWALASNTVLGACVAAGTANLIMAPVPLPFASFVPITSIQIAMVLKLARVFGLRLSLARAKEIVLTFGSGLLGRTLFHQLANLVPVAGYVLGTAIATGTTMALGYSMSAWYAYGERPSGEAIQTLSLRLARHLAHNLATFRDRRTLRKGIEAVARDALRRIEQIDSPQGGATAAGTGPKGTAGGGPAQQADDGGGLEP